MNLTAIDFSKIATAAVECNEAVLRVGLERQQSRAGATSDSSSADRGILAEEPYKKIISIISDAYITDDTFEKAFRSIAQMAGTYAATSLFKEFVFDFDVNEWAWFLHH